MHVEESGPPAAPRMLLLHGGGVAGWMWRPAARRLATSHRVIVPDLPGHGRSAGEPYRSSQHTVDAVAALLGSGAGPVAVVGFSLGGQLAVLLAAQHPGLVEQVVVVSAQARPMRFAGAALRLVGLTAPLARRRWFAQLQARALAVPPDLLADYLTTSVTTSRTDLVAAVGANLAFVPPPAWSRYPGRVLVLVGARERRLLQASARDLAAAAPHGELEVVPGCGHGVPLQAPGWFADRVAGWLA
ncbi:alpha/beta fold hydrolase [Auraticoccus cholistanensis]